MTNALGTAVCVVCIAAVNWATVPPVFAIPLFIALGLATGWFIERLFKTGGWR